MWALRPRLQTTQQLLKLTKSSPHSLLIYPGKIPFRNTLWVRYKHKSNVTDIIEPRYEKRPGKLSNTRASKQIIDIKHYLKSTDVPDKMRRNILANKVGSLVKSTRDLETVPELIPTIDQVILQLSNSDDELVKLIPGIDLAELFTKTALAVGRMKQPEYPQYMAILAFYFLKHDVPVSSEVLIHILDMGSLLRLGDFQATLSFILSYKAASLPATFSTDLLQHLWTLKKLTLDNYSTLAELDLLSDEVCLISDPVVTHFNNYLEYLYKDVNPDLHEYKDLDRNIYKVLCTANKMIETCLNRASTETLLQLLRMKSSLNSIVSNAEDEKVIRKILYQLNVQGEAGNFEDLLSVLFLQDLFDETLSETILLESVKNDTEFQEMCFKVASFIHKDDVKFSPSLRLRAQLISFSNDSRTSEFEEIEERILSSTESFFANSEDKSQSLSDVAQALMSISSIPCDKSYKFLSHKLVEANSVPAIDIYFFKHCIDRAILDDDPELALQIFFESTKNSSTFWSESSDPSINATLNRLISTIMKHSKDITQTFPTFRRIRLHMPGSIVAGTMNHLAKAMLAENCVGDVVEMLKRELPKIKKDSYHRLPVRAPWAYDHRSLFNTLIEYVVSYKGDTTSETNWQLYGELHKYFQIPFDSFFPVIQYFCEVDRLNAALVIFRTIKLLNELHGERNDNLPPLKEMCLYLLQIFGEKLYEEGVLEIHDCLKTDVAFENQDIDLQNCLLNAYANLQDVHKARDLFLAISAHPKESGGVNEETIQTMIKALTYGDLDYVNLLWNNLSTFGIFPNEAIFKQYVIAHVYHGRVEKAAELVSSIDDYNLEVTSDLLLAMHNYCLEPHKQKEMDEWLAENYTEEWQKLCLSTLLRSATKYEPERYLLADGGVESSN